MAYPPAYERTVSFTEFETLNPGEPKPGVDLDTEFDNVSNALTATQTNLALIQRADGELSNDSVGVDQLQDDVFDGIADALTADAEAAAAAAAASASSAAGSAAAADASADAAATSAAEAAGAAAMAGTSQSIAQNAANEAVISADEAETHETNAEIAANETAGSVAECEAHVQRAFEWAELLTGPVLPAPPGWPEAVDDGMFSAKWWAIRARDYNSVSVIDLGSGQADIGAAWDEWIAAGNEAPLGIVYATWGVPPITYILTDPNNPSDPASWMRITGADGPPGAVGPPGPQGPQGIPGPPGGAGTVADPTAVIGLTAVNGVAISAIRSDGAPALSQAIAPTWTGAHTFNGLVNLAGLLQASGVEGVSGQVLSSQGAGLPAIWRTSSGGSIELGWNFSSAVGTANPGSQKMSLNSAVYASVTIAVFNSLAFTNFDANTILSLLNTGNRIYMQQRNDSSKAAVYEVTGPGTNLTGYWTIPVRYIDSRGTIFPNNADMNVVFILSVSATSLANPTALVGLTAVNGIATTGMRSDAAPALSQAIVPTWTGQHIFRGTVASAGAVTQASLGTSSTYAVVSLTTSAAGTNKKTTQMFVDPSGDFFVGTLDEANTVVSNILRAQRGTGIAVAALHFGNATDNPTFDFLGTGIVTSGGVHRGPLGSVTAPTYSFSAQTNAGMFGNADGTLRFATNGVHSFILDSINSRNISYHSLQVVPDGTAALPAVAFINATNMGMYKSGTASLALSTAGALVAEFDASGVRAPNGFRADIGIRAVSNTNRLGMNVAEMAYGNVWVDGVGRGGYHGYGIADGLSPIFMSDGSGVAGLFVGFDTKWIIHRSTSILAITSYPLQGPSFTSTSSRAIKRETGAPSKARDILSRLRPILYRLLEGDDREQLGLIAEEVRDVCPQLSDGKAVSYDRLAILLLAAWQEQNVAAA